MAERWSAAALEAPAGALSPVIRGRLHVLVLVLAVLGAAAVLLPALDTLRPLLVLPAFVLLPGAAVLVFLRVESILSWLVLALLLSLAIQTLLSLLLLWGGAWHPMAQSLVLAVVAVVVVITDLVRRPGPVPARARVGT